MAKKKRIDLKLIVADALDYYHNYVKPSNQESTKRQNESLLSEFYRFVDTLPARDKTMKIFSQKGLNRYKEYLIDKMERSKTDGKKRNFGVGQLNRCGGIIALLINQVLVDKEDGIVKVSWKKVDDPRSEYQKGHIPLLDDEVAAIENCSGLTPVEEVYRDIFLLQVESGHRVSDLCKILTGKYWIEQGEKEKFIVFSTQKENIKGRVIVTSRVNILTEELKSQKLIDLNRFEEKTKGKGNNTYNEAIRRIAKKAKLDREIVKIDSTQIEIRRPLYETISSHDARCTFITKKVIEGWPYDRLCWLTGHASDDMIKRVYAQLTDTAKIKAIESFLSSGKNEKEDDSPTDSSSINPSELKSEEVVAEEMPNDSITDAYERTSGMVPESLPLDNVINTDSSNQFKFEDYVKGLDDIVDSTIREEENRLNKTLQFASEWNPMFEEGYNEIKNIILEKDINSKEGIIESWNDCLEYCERVNDNLPEIEKGFEDIYKLVLLRVLMDYCKENHLGDDLIKIIEKLDTELHEENPTVYYTYNMLNLDREVLPAFLLTAVSGKALIYVFQNRLKVASLIIDAAESLHTLNRELDLSLVLNELNRFPAIELQAMIKDTNLNYDTRVKLYRSVVNHDVEQFADIVKSSEHELSGLIELAYFMNWTRGLIKIPDEFFKEDSNPIDGFAKFDTFQLLNNPFSDLEISSHEIMENGANEDYILSQMNRCLEGLEIFKSRALQAEKRIINKIFKLLDQFPKLKDAYNDYKAKQQAASNLTEDTLDPPSGDNVRIEGKTVKKQKVGTNYITFNSENIDVDKLIKLLTEKDKLNKYKQFITVLESTDNVNVATCLKHFLGTTSKTPLSFRLKWNGRTKVSLKFLIRLITNTNEEASRLNVIDESEYDGISPDVCEVFGGSTGYMMSVGLGKEGDKARKLNIEQIETIVEIYFACKK